MLFKVNDQHLVHLAQAVTQFGAAWIHGDGNIYVDESSSNFRKDFSNPELNGNPSAPKYRAFFDQVDDIPETVEELEKMFLSNAQKEMREQAKQKDKTNLKVLAAAPAKATQSAPAPAALHLAAKEKDLAEWDEQLGAREQEVEQGAQKVQEASKVLGQREKELARREAELAEKMAALTANKAPEVTKEPKAK